MGDPARSLGAASTALAPLVRGPVTNGRVAGSTTGLAWLMVGDQAMVVTGPGAGRLPNAFLVSGDRWRPLETGGHVEVGGGCVVLTGSRVGVGRWWEARPSLGRIDAGALRAAIVRCGPPTVDDGGLGRALARRNEGSVLEAAARLLGAGEGLTPLGDDILTGAMAALVVFGQAAGMDEAPGTAALIGWVLAAAPARTSALSVSLLRCAAAGRVAGPVARLFRALGGAGDIARARTATERMGHTSGTGLLAGVLAGVACVAGGRP